MGYYENCCQLCAVSFNVARYRTKNEPENAAWGYSGDEYYAGDLEGFRCSEKSSESGCENVDLESPAERMHLAGPGCCATGAYSGHRISVAEMKGMNLPRHIVKKPLGAIVPDDETECERTSDYFITSSSARPPKSWDTVPLARVRYGVEKLFTQNYENICSDDLFTTGLPVHSTCWQIFEQVSLLRLGYVDLQGFMALWKREGCGQCGFKSLKQDSIILSCKQQWWYHLPGTEYLAANPVDIPGFDVMVQSSFSQGMEGESVFYSKDEDKKSSKSQSQHDPFSKLSAELQYQILTCLSSRDTARLRLVSRSFRQLPKRLFKHLIRQELPWFWEMDTFQELNNQYWKEGLAEVGREYTPHEPNWRTVYEWLQVMQKGLLGVRNRVRIWAVVEEVVARIMRLRANLDGAELQVEPTEQERAAGAVRSAFDCPRCTFWQY